MKFQITFLSNFLSNLFNFTAERLFRAIVELMFAAAINSDGHLRNELEYCKIPNSQVHLNYTAIDAVTVTNYITLINHFIREKIDDVHLWLFFLLFSTNI